MNKNSGNEWALRKTGAKIPAEIGVVNPELLRHLYGRTLRFLLLRVIGLSLVRDQIRDKARADTYAILGDFDILCESIDGDIYSLRDDVIKRVGLTPLIESTATYTATECLWFHGRSRDQMEIKQLVQLSPEEISSAESLLKDWNDPKISNDMRQALKTKKVVFPSVRPPDGILFYMWISVLGVTSDEMLANFGNLLLLTLRPYEDNVQELYRVVGAPVSYQFLLKLAIDQFPQINEINNAVNDIRKKWGFKVITRTYAVQTVLHKENVTFEKSLVEKTSVKALKSALLDHQFQKIEDILKFLSSSEIMKIVELPQAQQSSIFDRLSETENYWKNVPFEEVVREPILGLLRGSQKSLFRAIISGDLSEYSHGYLQLIQAIERLLADALRMYCLRQFADEKESQRELDLPSKDIGSLPLGHVLRGISIWHKKFPKNRILSPVLLGSIKPLVELRNKCSHGRLEILSPSDIYLTSVKGIQWLTEYLSAGT